MSRLNRFASDMIAWLSLGRQRRAAAQLRGVSGRDPVLTSIILRALWYSELFHFLQPLRPGTAIFSRKSQPRWRDRFERTEALRRCGLPLDRPACEIAYSWRREQPDGGA